MKKIKENYFKRTITQLIDNLKIGKTVLLTTAYDIIYWILFFGITYLTGQVLKQESSLLRMVKFDQQAMLASSTLAQTNVTLVQTYLIKSIIIILIFITIMLLIYTITTGLIWAALFNKKPNKKYFTEFFKLNLIWMIVWIAPILFLLFAMQDTARNYFAIFLFAAYLHFTTILQTTFAQKNSIKEAYASLALVGIGKIHYFMLPYLFTALVYLLLTRLLYLLPSRSLLIIAAAMIIWIFSIAWFRKYMKDVILSVE